MSTQKDIDDLLNDSLLASSNANVARSLAQESKPKQAYEDTYGNQQFEDYEESRRTNGLRQSRSEIQESRQMKKGGKLTEIKEEPSTAKQGKVAVPKKKANQVTEFKTHSNFKDLQKTKFPDKLNLPHNFAHMQERQRELLVTTLTEENRQLKADLQQKNKQCQMISGKYRLLLQEKGHNNSTAKEMALQKKVAFLQQKLKKVNDLKKIEQQRNRYSTKISNKQQNFIPEEESNRRESQLLDLIDKLKERLIHSDQNMTVLQKKLHEHVEYNDQLHRKMKRVEQLEHRIDKMVEQAETDRNYIELLKEKIKELEEKNEKEKNKYAKLQVEVKRLQMGQFTHSDIMEELKQTRRQKQMLQKSLKELSSTMMKNVRTGGNKASDPIEDSNELLRC